MASERFELSIRVSPTAFCPVRIEVEEQHAPWFAANETTVSREIVTLLKSRDLVRLARQCAREKPHSATGRVVGVSLEFDYTFVFLANSDPKLYCVAFNMTGWERARPCDFELRIRLEPPRESS